MVVAKPESYKRNAENPYTDSLDKSIKITQTIIGKLQSRSFPEPINSKRLPKQTNKQTNKPNKHQTMNKQTDKQTKKQPQSKI